MTNNSHVLEWIEEMKALVKPDKVVWVTGGEEQIKLSEQKQLPPDLWKN